VSRPIYGACISFIHLAAIAVFLCSSSMIVYGQTLPGKWETDAVTGGKSSVVLDLKTDNNNTISGTVFELTHGETVTITEGTVTEKTFTFKTAREINGTTIVVTWNGQITDDNTLRVTRGQGVALRGAVAKGRGVGVVPIDPPRNTRGTPPPPPPQRLKADPETLLILHRSR
jgi:hypothetical protein